MNTQLRRLLLDLGPLVAFFLAFQFFGIYVATGTFMVLVLVSLATGYWLEKKVSAMALFSALIVIVFGGLTIYLKNDTFLKIKPTIIYATFCAVLLGGLAFNRLFIKYVLSFEFDMPESAWRTLTWRWGLFFASLAVLKDAAAPAELLVLGCGARAIFVVPALRAELKAAGLALEVVDTGSACRIYNVLLAEGRRVAAALIPL